MLISMHFSRLEANRNLALVLQIQLRQSDVSIRQGIAAPLKEYFKIIEGIVEEGVKSGAFREDVNSKLARQMIFGTMDEVATSWVMSSRRYKLADQIEPVYSLLARALSRDGSYPAFPKQFLNKVVDFIF